MGEDHKKILRRGEVGRSHFHFFHMLLNQCFHKLDATMFLDVYSRAISFIETFRSIFFYFRKLQTPNDCPVRLCVRLYNRSPDEKDME